MSQRKAKQARQIEGKNTINLLLSNKAAQIAMKQEINRQILEHDRQFAIDSDVTVLWTIHVCLGLGKDRLRKFWETLFQEHEQLRKYYKMEQGDLDWLYRKKLKDIGVDVEAWYKEIEEGDKNHET